MSLSSPFFLLPLTYERSGIFSFKEAQFLTPEARLAPADGGCREGAGALWGVYTKLSFISSMCLYEESLGCFLGTPG